MKNIISVFIIILITAMPTFAEKVPVAITPLQIISTNHDEIETGDKVDFQVIEDIYSNKNLYIPKYSLIVGTVDFVQPNGWGGDPAEIRFNSFETIDINKNKFVIPCNLCIKGTNDKANNSKQVFQYTSWLLMFIRGSEIFIEPDTKVYNIFIEK